MKSIVHHGSVSFLSMTCLVIASLLPAGVAAKQNAGTDAREAFRSFYQPLLPKLLASYSNVEYRITIPGNGLIRKRIKYFTGQIGHEHFRRSAYSSVWSREKEYSIEVLERLFPGEETRYETIVLGPDNQFRIAYSLGEASISAYRRDESLWSSEGDVVLAPTWCIAMRWSFAELLDRGDVKFIEFSEGKGRNGANGVKRLMFRPSGIPDECVFEAGFDSQTGSCLYQYEFGQIGGQGEFLPRLITVDYAEASDNPALLPKPVRIHSSPLHPSLSDGEAVFVLTYNRPGTLPDDSFLPSLYGFSNSLSIEYFTVAETVTSGAKNLLIILVSLASVALLSIVVLVGAIKFFAAPKNNAP